MKAFCESIKGFWEWLGDLVHAAFPLVENVLGAILAFALPLLALWVFGK